MVCELRIPLDIPNVKVLHMEITPGEKVIIEVESTLSTTRCRQCGQEINCNYGHGETITLRHLAVFGMETHIQLRPRRGQCKWCADTPTTTQVLSWYTPRSPHTQAYDAHLVKQLVNSTIEDVSMKESVGYDAVVGALNRQVDVDIDWSAITDLSTVGIDEIAMRKGHKDYAAIITGRQSDGQVRILAVLPDRKKRV